MKKKALFNKAPLPGQNKECSATPFSSSRNYLILRDDFISTVEDGSKPG